MKDLLNSLEYHQIKAFNFIGIKKKKNSNTSQSGKKESITRNKTYTYKLFLQALSREQQKQFLERIDNHTDNADKLIIDTTNPRFVNYMRTSSVSTEFECDEKDFKPKPDPNVFGKFTLTLTLKEVIYL